MIETFNGTFDGIEFEFKLRRSALWDLHWTGGQVWSLASYREIEYRLLTWAKSGQPVSDEVVE